jgi:DNA sulfur modification protein DndD
MLIKSITIKNFLPFYGENKIEFNNGLNLILGDIGKGKTALFNAFYWCLYDEIYITDEGWKKTKALNTSFINERAKTLLEHSEQVETFVKLTVEIDDKEYSSLIEYNIVKKYIFKKIKEDIFELVNSSFTLSYFEPREGDIILSSDNAKTFIESFIFPNKISSYIWFQGESIDKLIDLKDSITFKKAVEYLSYLKYYDNIYRIVKDSIDAFEKEKRKKISKDNINQKCFNDINEKIRKAEKSKSDYLSLYKKKIEEKEEVLNKIIETEKLLNNFDKFPELKTKKTILENEIKNFNDKIDQKDIEERINFSKKWMLKGMIPIIKEAENKLTEFEVWRQNQINKEISLPEDVPGDQYINLMLKAQKCLLCDREANEGSEAYKAIKDKLNRKAKSALLNPEIENLNNKVNTLKYWPRKLILILANVDDDIKASKKAIQDLISLRNKKTDDLKDVISEIDNIQKKHGINIDIAAADSIRNRNSFKYFTERKNDLNIEIDHAERKIKEFELEIKKNNDELNNLSAKSDNKIPEIEFLKYTEALEGILKKVRESEYKQLVEDIESKANFQYRKIAEVNNSIKGIIKINPETNLINIYDEDGKTWIPSTGHLTLIKMSIINAIITKSNEYKGQSFPFITDAPSSSLDDPTTKSYSEVISEIFEQSIIMTKDLLNIKEELVKNSKVKRLLILETKTEGKEKRATLSNTYSIINIVK